MVYLLLALAIAGEVAATLSLKISDGFTKPWPVVVVVVGYLVAFTSLGFVLKLGMPIGVAYAIWCAFGIAAVAAAGVVLFGERLNPLMIGGLVLVVLGVVAIELGSASAG
ncbi:DMT family transporter [Saccharothrix obliqua]|uniref:DMT family transporter n=1 Tax=Saccharothrix obliqua TaxID=2861747 RepID=UPI001C5F692E|nr:SMR family transporter [Saccharothrix obliqua]MBW4715600.1 QacE family quaternary ammonium compound efflux SMR transporter [Saccharothrix obliqua]